MKQFLHRPLRLPRFTLRSLLIAMCAVALYLGLRRAYVLPPDLALNLSAERATEAALGFALLGAVVGAWLVQSRTRAELLATSTLGGGGCGYVVAALFGMEIAHRVHWMYPLYWDTFDQFVPFAVVDIGPMLLYGSAIGLAVGLFALGIQRRAGQVA